MEKTVKGGNLLVTKTILLIDGVGILPEMAMPFPSNVPYAWVTFDEEDSSERVKVKNNTFKIKNTSFSGNVIVLYSKYDPDIIVTIYDNAVIANKP
jgi:hypothetical protein